MSSFRHVVIVVLENASRDTVLTNQYMRDLRRKGVFLANSYCVTHPSQPNYFTMVAGDTVGVVNDNNGWVYWHQATAPLEPGGTVYPDVTSIVDLLEHKKLSWKAYAENYTAPGADSEPCCPGGLPNSIAPNSAFDLNTPLNQQTPFNIPIQCGGGSDPLFARRHVPFLSFPNIVNNPERLDKIVNADQFEQDLPKDLPHYSFYTPNLIHDGHNSPDGTKCSPFVDTAQLKSIEAFLKSFLGDDPIARFPPETLIVITFDESYGADAHYGIYTLLIGDMLEAGTVRHEPYNHYSLLRTIEDNFDLGTLGRNDAAATPYWFVRCQHGN